MIVYIVTVGEYSDYRIERVFLNYEKAEQYIALQNRDQNRYQEKWNIEEYETSDDTLEGEIKVYYLYTFDFRGDRARIDSVEIVGYPKKEFSRYRFGEKWFLMFEFTLEEENPEKALKIAQDEYAKMRALEF